MTTFRISSGDTCNHFAWRPWWDLSHYSNQLRSWLFPNVPLSVFKVQSFKTKVNGSFYYCWLITKQVLVTGWTTYVNLLYEWFTYSCLFTLNCNKRNHFNSKNTHCTPAWGLLQEDKGRWRTGNHCYYMWSFRHLIKWVITVLFWNQSLLGKKQEREAARQIGSDGSNMVGKTIKNTKSVNISYKTLNIPVSSCCHCCVILLLDEEFPGAILKGKLKRSVWGRDVITMEIAHSHRLTHSWQEGHTEHTLLCPFSNAYVVNLIPLVRSWGFCLEIVITSNFSN